MKMQYSTIQYEIEEALEYLRKLSKEIKTKKISEQGFLFEMEHIFLHLNLAKNARFLSKKTISELSQKEFSKLCTYQE